MLPVKKGQRLVENARELPANISTEFELGQHNSTSPAAALQTADLRGLQMEAPDNLACVSWPVDTRCVQ